MGETFVAREGGRARRASEAPKGRRTIAVRLVDGTERAKKGGGRARRSASPPRETGAGRSGERRRARAGGGLTEQRHQRETRATHSG